MLCPYALKALSEKSNKLNVEDYGINPMEKFSDTTPEINLENHYTWGCPVYVLDVILQGNISGLTKWEPRSHSGIYLGHSLFHVVSVALVLNPATGHVSPQFHVVFDDEFSIVPFMRECKIIPNWKDLV